MELFRKKQLIELVETLPNGDVKVQNQGQPNDQWVIPKEVFETTYEAVIAKGEEWQCDGCWYKGSDVKCHYEAPVPHGKQYCQKCIDMKIWELQAIASQMHEGVDAVVTKKEIK